MQLGKSTLNSGRVYANIVFLVMREIGRISIFDILQIDMQGSIILTWKG